MTDNGKVFKLSNSYLDENDHLYHIGLLQTDDLEKRFHDVKYVCMGGKPKRMKEFAEYMYQDLGKPQNSEFDENGGIKDISESAGRYSMFKVGPFLSVSHGIGLEPGTIVITEQSFDGELNPKFYQAHCGKAVRLLSETNESLRKDLVKAATQAAIPVLIGNTMSTDDFFEGQARTDGAFCDYSKEDKMKFLRKAHDEHGVKNIEMESLCFAAMCTRAKVKCAVACVTILDRLKRDDVTADGSALQAWQDNLFKLMSSYMKIKN